MTNQHEERGTRPGEMAPDGGPSQMATGRRTERTVDRSTSWATVAFGLVCMTVASLALTLQLADLQVDWEVAGPAPSPASG